MDRITRWNGYYEEYELDCDIDTHKFKDKYLKDKDVWACVYLQLGRFEQMCYEFGIKDFDELVEIVRKAKVKESDRILEELELPLWEELQGVLENLSDGDEHVIFNHDSVTFICYRQKNKLKLSVATNFNSWVFKANLKNYTKACKLVGKLFYEEK